MWVLISFRNYVLIKMVLLSSWSYINVVAKFLITTSIWVFYVWVMYICRLESLAVKVGYVELRVMFMNM